MTQGLRCRPVAGVVMAFAAGVVTPVALGVMPSAVLAVTTAQEIAPVQTTVAETPHAAGPGAAVASTAATKSASPAAVEPAADDAPPTASPASAPLPDASAPAAAPRDAATSSPQPFDDRCMAGLAPAERRLIRATRARLLRSAPGEAPPALFHNSAQWGCARLRFHIDAAGLAQELKVDQAWPDWTYARAAWRLVQELRFRPAETGAAGDAALIVINLAGGATRD